MIFIGRYSGTLKKAYVQAFRNTDVQKFAGEFSQSIYEGCAITTKKCSDQLIVLRRYSVKASKVKPVLWPGVPLL